MYSLMLYSFLRNKHLKMMDHNLMSVDRGGRGRHSSHRPHAGDVGMYQFSLHLHRLRGFWRCEKAAVGGEQRWEIFFPSFPLRVTMLGSWQAAELCPFTISPSGMVSIWQSHHLLHCMSEWLMNEWFFLQSNSKLQYNHFDKIKTLFDILIRIKQVFAC